MTIQQHFGRRAARHVRQAHEGERGAVAVIAALVMTVLVGTLALVVDLGYGYGQRRLAQNVADSAAVAATKVVARHITDLGAGLTPSQRDADVLKAIRDVGTRSSGRFVTLLGGGSYADQFTAIYLDTALSSLGVEVGLAADGNIPSAARAIRVAPRKTNATLFASVLGSTTMVAQARATARTDAVTGLHPGFYAPYVIWGGEEKHKCLDGAGNPLTYPNGEWRGGCNLLDPANSSINYRCNQYDKCNISNKNPRWQVNSAEFKGYLHTSSGFLGVSEESTIDVQGGNAIGTASEPLDELERCYQLRDVGCAITLPIIDWAQNAGSDGIRMRVVGFAAVRLSNNPATASTGTPWSGTVVAGSIVCCGAGVVVTGPEPSPGVPSVQFVRLVQ